MRSTYRPTTVDPTADAVCAGLDADGYAVVAGLLDPEALAHARAETARIFAATPLGRDDFEGCSFVNVMLETADAEHPIGRASAEHLENIRSVLRSLAEEAGLRDTDEFARSFHILMKGSIVQAAEGDVEAAKRAQQMAADLIEKYRQPT